MKKTILILIIFSALLSAQEFKVEKVKGIVKAQIGTSEEWREIKEGTSLKSNTILLTEKNSSVELSGDKIKFTLKESSSIPLKSIKKLSVDELLLALAMEDIISTPKKNNQDKTESTAVYGTKENDKKSNNFTSSEFGIKRLNGAKQLAENGFKESAVVVAKETFRKYPETNANIFYRIYFADILYEIGLSEEAFEEYKEIKNLALNEKENLHVEKRVEELNQKLIAN